MPKIKSHPSFDHYSFFFKIVNGSFFVFDKNKNILFYSGEKDFKRSEYFRIYSDQNRNQELLSMSKNEKGLWEIKDSTTGKIIGFLKESIFSGQKIFSEDKQKIGEISNRDKIMTILIKTIIGFGLLLLLDQLVRTGNQFLITSTIYNEKIGEINEKSEIDDNKEHNMLIESQSFMDKKLVVAAGFLFVKNLF